MKPRLLLLIFFFSSLSNVLLAAPSPYIQIKNVARGAQKINGEAPYERMPVFIKAGSVIPFGPELQYTAEKPTDTITLNLYTGADTSFNLYEDEGTNYNYEKGAFSIIPIRYNEATKTITIDDRKGSFNHVANKNFPHQHLFPKRTKCQDFDASDKKACYEGNNITIKNGSFFNH